MSPTTTIMLNALLNLASINSSIDLLPTPKVLSLTASQWSIHKASSMGGSEKSQGLPSNFGSNKVHSFKYVS